MNISLRKSELKDAVIIHKMQIKSFMSLLEKYQDYETSPANGITLLPWYYDVIQLLTILLISSIFYCCINAKIIL